MNGGGEKDLLQRVEFGIEVEAFMRGPIGEHLLTRLREEAEQALETLKTGDLRDTEKFIEARLIIRRTENIDSWLAGIIQEGWHAENQLKGEEL
jgi:hypothetical protein